MSTLETRIAEVLAAHKAIGLRGMGLRGPDVIADCKCGVEVLGGPEGMRAHQAAVLAPVIREREAEAFDEGVHETDSMTGDSLSDAVIDTAKMNNPYRSNDE